MGVGKICVAMGNILSSNLVDGVFSSEVIACYACTIRVIKQCLCYTVFSFAHFIHCIHILIVERLSSTCSS